MTRAREVTLIATSSATGLGTQEDPVRTVFELWTTDGQIVACRDSHTGDSLVARTIEELVRL